MVHNCFYLKDGFKIEINSIPESELSAGGTCDESPPIRDPLQGSKCTTQLQSFGTASLRSYRDAVHGTSCLVSRGTDKLSCDRIDWAFLKSKRQC